MEGLQFQTSQSETSSVQSGSWECGGGGGGGACSGADGDVRRPTGRPASLLDLRLLRGAGRSLHLLGLLPVLLLLLLDLQDQLLDLLTLRLHPLLREPVGQVERQVEAGDRTLLEDTKIHENVQKCSELSWTVLQLHG